MKLTGESKLLLGILGGTVLLVVGAIAVFSRPTPPTPVIPLEQLVSDNRASRGPEDAPVLLVEFSDFQCPACLAAKPVVDAVLAKYPTQVRFIYRHFPLDQHAYSKQAAQAAEAAKLQGKFWEMYDGLFEKQQSLSDETVKALATSLNFRMEAFEKDWKDASIAALVAEDRAQGEALGTRGTPTFFLNGKKLTLASWSDLMVEVEKAVNSGR